MFATKERVGVIKGAALLATVALLARVLDYRARKKLRELLVSKVFGLSKENQMNGTVAGKRAIMVFF